MKLSDLLPSEKDMDRAKATIDELSTKKRNTEIEEDRLRIANGVLARSKWVRIAIVSAGLSGAAGLLGYGIYSGSKEDQQSGKADIAQSGSSTQENSNSAGHREQEGNQEGNKERVDKIVQMAEAGMGKLKETVENDINSLEDEKLKHMFNQAFLLMQINQDNPNKNHPRFLEQQSDKTTAFKQKNINYFGYNITTEKDKGTVASYIPPMRLMKLSPEFDKDNLLDALIMYHECQHVLQDTSVRAQLDTKEKYEKYMGSFFKKRDRIAFNVLAEGTAYAFEIELLDMILGGKLRRHEKLDAEEVRKALNARQGQMGTIKLLLGMADEYFGTNSSLSAGLNKRYLDHLVSIYDPSKYEPIWDSSPHN